MKKTKIDNMFNNTLPFVQALTYIAGMQSGQQNLFKASSILGAANIINSDMTPSNQHLIMAGVALIEIASQDPLYAATALMLISAIPDLLKLPHMVRELRAWLTDGVFAP